MSAEAGLIRGGILTVGEDQQEATEAVLERLQAGLPGFFLQESRHVTGPRYLLEEILRRWCDEVELDLLVTVGGTGPAPGPSPQEVTPEATLAVVERLLPGLPEQMRALAQEEDPRALLDRSVAGIRGRTVLVNLPGQPGLARLFLDGILEVLPPLMAALRPPPTPPDRSAGKGRSQGLDPEEFAAFRRRRAQETGVEGGASRTQGNEQGAGDVDPP